MTELIQVQTTTGSEEDANHISSFLLEKKLVACVQVSGPIRSCYVWKGVQEETIE